MIKIYFLPLPENKKWSDTDGLLAHKISGERLWHLLHLKSTQNKRLSMYSGLLARFAISEALHVPHNELKFNIQMNERYTYMKRGEKPLLISPEAPDFDFNISHTRDAILVGVNTNGLIGVDIENCKRRRPPLNIMKRFYHADEAAYVNEDPEKQTVRFYECWTRKEAYVKHDGSGITSDLSKINTTAGDTADMLYTWQKDDYICSVCVKKAAREGTAEPLISDSDIICVDAVDMQNYFLSKSQLSELNLYITS